ncbi:hypothetical protein SAMN05444161_3172 [Rhizobiales bacterium GAS191]|nr:hypothetical protein SAMN05444161_3172 [Rhizobiales bacterium GAS191]
MTLDPKWLDALKLPLKVTIAVALASIALLTLDLKGILDLGPFATYAKPILIVLSVVFSILTLVGVVDELLAPRREKRRQTLLAGRRAVRRREEQEQRAESRERVREQVLARLDHLSKEELRYVADCLRKGSPSFYTYIYSPPVSILVAKGLVWSPGGQHHQDHYPFSFTDYVWETLVERKAEFIAKDEAEEAESQPRGRRRP